MYYVASTKKQSTYPLKEELKAHGFLWDPKQRAWAGECTDQDFLKYLDRKGVKITDTQYKRSSTYREVFFKYNNPPYHCAYCGSKLYRKDLTVDHWIPIHKLETGKHRRFYQRMLRRFCHTDNPNNPQNLVCACETCNKKKQSKTGHWLLRGALGKHITYWYIQKILWAASLFYAIYMLMPALENHI